MEKITEISDVLKKRELVNLRYWFHGNKNDVEKKGMELLEELLKGKYEDDRALSRKLFNRDPEPAYWRIKGKLAHLMADFLLVGEGRDKFESEYLMETFDVRKKIQQADILLKRGAYTPAVYLMNKSADLAEKWDLLYEKVFIYDLMATHMGTLHGKNVYEKYAEKYHKSLEEFNLYMKSKHYSQELEVPYAFFDLKEDGFKEKATKYIAEQKEAFAKTNSANIGYYYLHTGATANRIMKNFTECIRFSEELIELLKKKTEIYSDARLGMAYGQICQANLGLHDYKNALKAAQKSVELFSPETVNELRAMELIFISAFHAGDLKLAEDIVKDAFNHPHLEMSNLDFSKWQYFKAQILFKKGNYVPSLNQLNKINILFRDKSGWIVGLKMLEMMNLVESGIDYTLTYHRMDSMVQMLARQKDVFASKVWRVGTEEGMILTRILAISKVIQTLLNKNSDFYLTKLECEKELKLLSEGKGDYDWNPAGLELSRFDVWFDKNCPKPITVKKG
ncbi:MAG: hypothetical protein A3G23_00475 [Bacteroidetes bacterium RIFCSPLOWO2_12_FULL_37_12]|nr:MAG: hypothetical protein A3G23_00475 [Bacteroidetes bacterium RIFCSPLOWO2_12_FULL_37_12]